MERPSPSGRTAAWLFATLLTLYLGVTRGHFISIDEVNVYQTARSLWERGALTVNPIAHSFVGRDGKYYSQYDPGLSVAAVPLYALGKYVRERLQANGHPDWIQALAGRRLEIEGIPALWGGEVEIFFVNLFNGFVTALACTLFFLVCVRHGVSRRNAALLALLVGTVSYVAAYAVGFLQHSAETLFVLAAYYFLLADRQAPRAYYRTMAGLALGLALLFRLPAAIAWPAFGAYLGWVIWQRNRGLGPRRVGGALLREGWPFVVPLVGALAVHFAVSYLKFGSFHGPYDARFDNPLLAGLYMYLFSPGLSVFLFTPLLVLLFWAFAPFWRRSPAEAALLGGLTVSYLLLYAVFGGDPTGEYNGWGWEYGPRYVLPVTTLLLLPLAPWIDEKGRRAWLYMAPFVLLGLWMQATHVGVNWIYTVYSAGYGYEQDVFKPKYAFIFVPHVAPVVAMSKALLAGDYRVDMWLVNLYRELGPGYLWKPLAVWVLALALSAWRFYRSVIPDRGEPHPP